MALGKYSAQALGKLGGRQAVEAGTFMHELGHALGLCHGGSLPWGIFDCAGLFSTHRKPNYLSVMNYSFQMPSVVPDRPLDYSRWTLDALNEHSLQELDGLGTLPTGLSTRWKHTTFIRYDKASNICVHVQNGVSAIGPIDWDGDGFYTIAQAGINYLDTSAGPGPKECQKLENLGWLFGSQDWDYLRFNMRTNPKFAEGALRGRDTIDELTIEEITESAQQPGANAST